MTTSPTSDKRSSSAVGGSARRGRWVGRAGACVEGGPGVRRSRREVIVGIGAAVAIGVVSVLVSASAASPTTVVLETVARAIAVGLPVAVGLMAWTRPPFERFGRLLVATGAGVLAVTLSLSDDAVLYSTGRVVHWGVEAALVYLILAFPSGGLAQRVDRALATAAALLVALLFLPTALLVESYPTPAPWVSCASDCPRNAFMAVADEPRVIEQLVTPAQVVLAIALFVAIIARLADRVRGATRLGRLTLTPVLVVAMGWALVLAVTLGVRLAWPGSALVEGMVWLVAFTVPAMAVAFLIGLMRWWVYVGASLRRLPGWAGGPPGAPGARIGWGARGRPRSCASRWRTRSRTRRWKSSIARAAGSMTKGTRWPCR